MTAAPVVSVITSFFNEERFITEAIESVISQTYESWELLLVDDGSDDASTEIARRYARSRPDKIRYLEHSDHMNLGLSAARNVGHKNSRGDYLAFLDADDIWLPDKLARQVPRLADDPAIGMIYGATKYWHGWTNRPEDIAKDHMWFPVREETVFNPPQLLAHFLDGTVLMPCMGSILIRRDVVERMGGGWENAFRGLYEDWVFFAKVCLSSSIRVTNECLDWYRQHDNSMCAVAHATGELPPARRRFLDWLTQHLEGLGLRDTESWQALARERAR
jgi:glycosyltransferase involved in cell wall biosynthesis